MQANRPGDPGQCKIQDLTPNAHFSGCIEIPPVNGVSKAPVSAVPSMAFECIETNPFPYTVLDGPVRLDREGLAARNGRYGRR